MKNNKEIEAAILNINECASHLTSAFYTYSTLDTVKEYLGIIEQDIKYLIKELNNDH